MQNNRLFVGNPGVGKSSIINCIAGKVLFESGISVGAGLTYQLGKINHNGIVYMDTPGLADIKLRQNAATAIKEALTQTGSYQIFFVLTLEAGRLRPEDVATMKLILESAREITVFSIIINKVSPRMETDLTQNDRRNLTQLIAEADIACGNNVQPPETFILGRQDALEDTKNTFVNIDSLNNFIGNAPSVIINPSNVNDISTQAFDQVLSNMDDQIQAIRNDNAAMQQRIKETDRKCRELGRKPLLERVPILGPVIAPVVGTAAALATPFVKPVGAVTRPIVKPVENTVKKIFKKRW